LGAGLWGEIWQVSRGLSTPFQKYLGSPIRFGGDIGGQHFPTLLSQNPWSDFPNLAHVVPFIISYKPWKFNENLEARFRATVKNVLPQISYVYCYRGPQYCSRIRRVVGELCCYIWLTAEFAALLWRHTIIMHRDAARQCTIIVWRHKSAPD